MIGHHFIEGGRAMGRIVAFPMDEDRRLVLRMVQTIEWQTPTMGRRFWRSTLDSLRLKLAAAGLDDDAIDLRVRQIAARVESELLARADAGAPLPYEAA